MFYELEKVENCRDLGGIVTKDGYKIKANKLFRAGLLSTASENDIQKLKELGIDVIVDFRSSEEVNEKPDIIIEGVDNFNLQANEENMQGVSREEKDSDLFVERMIKASLENPMYFRDYMVDCYRKLINSNYSNGIYRQFLDILVNDQYDSVLWHCTAGKDRTGVATLFILEILNVDKETIYENYLETNKYLNGSSGQLIQYLYAVIKDKNVADQIAEGFKHALSARKEFIDAAYEEMEKVAGSVEDFLRNNLGVDETLRNKIREKYLEK